MRCLLRDGHRIVLRARQHRKGLQRSARQKGSYSVRQDTYTYYGLLTTYID